MRSSHSARTDKMQASQYPEVAEHIVEGGVLVVSGSSHIQLGGRNLMKLRAIVGLTREAAGDKTFDLTMSSFDRPATWIMELRLRTSRLLCRPALQSGKIHWIYRKGDWSILSLLTIASHAQCLDAHASCSLGTLCFFKQLNGSLVSFWQHSLNG